MIRVLLTLSALTACSAVRGCFNPGIPDVPDPADDTSEPEHTGDTEPGDTEPIDTAPPPPCAQPEIEPNYNGSNATPIAMESWACGIFGEAFDFDVFEFEIIEDSWLEVEVQAVSRGSVANAVMTLESSSGMAAASERGPRSNDPYLVVPVPAVDTWLIRLTEAQQGFGEEYDYQVIASVTKPPFYWDDVEVANNGSIEEAQTIEEDHLVYGTIDSATAFDWYHFRTPEGRHRVTVEIFAHDHGSPLLPRLQLYFIDDATYPQQTVDEDPNSASLDPVLERTSDGGEDWYFKVRYRPEQRYGDLYWYGIRVTADVQ